MLFWKSYTSQNDFFKGDYLKYLWDGGTAILGWHTKEKYVWQRCKNSKEKNIFNYFQIQLEATNVSLLREVMNSCLLCCFLKNKRNEKGIEVSG